MSRIKELLCVSEEDVRNVRKSFNKTEEDIHKDINILLEWLSKQPHLPAPHNVDRLERFLLRNKFRIERTKMKLEKYYTYRGLYPDFCLHLAPTSVGIQNARKSTTFVPMPTLLPGSVRLCIMRFEENQGDLFNYTDMISNMLMILDLQLSYDYAFTDNYVIDCKYLTMKHFYKMDPNSLHKSVLLHQHAFSGRVVHLQYVHVSAAFNSMLSLVKRVFDAKMFGKILVHKTLESLHANVPREYLPKEFEGDQPSIYEIHEKWNRELITQTDFLNDNAKRISDENLRIGQSFQDDLFGIDGTFKKINLD